MMNTLAIVRQYAYQNRRIILILWGGKWDGLNKQGHFIQSADDYKAKTVQIHTDYLELTRLEYGILERELQNESRQHNRQQSKTKRREEEVYVDDVTPFWDNVE